MTRTIWLASYPKSGNTWMRALIANLSAQDAPVDINHMPELGGIASGRATFDDLTLIDSELLTPDEVDALRPRVHEEVAHSALGDDDDNPGDRSSVRFVKVHDAYTLNTNGEPLLGGRRGADGAIVIVRDPRDVAPSLANHIRRSIDSAIAFMNDNTSGFSMRRERLDLQFRQKLLSWSGHVASWLEQTDIPVHRVRYEDMQADTAAALRAALDFAQRPASEQDISRAVRFANFSELQSQERAKGFREIRRHGGGLFFRRGETGSWRDELTPEQVACIEANHASMMQRLGYEVSTTGALARAG